MPWKGKAPKYLGAEVVALLGRGQERMKHLDRRLEHLDELQQALGGAVEAAGEAE